MFRKFMAISVAGLALCATPAMAGLSVIDGTIEACTVQQTFGPIPADGSIEIPITDWNLGDFPDCGDVANPANRDPFSINYFGTTYSSFYLNENGVLTFGAPITDSPSTPLLMLDTPAIAPFFGDIANDPSVRVGFELGGPGAMWLSWNVEEEGGDGSTNRFQLSFQQVGTEGDFDLIMNYINVDWDPGQVGFTDGAGSGFVFDGSGIDGGLLGDDNDNNPMCGPTSIACNVGFGGMNPSEPSATGFYVFQFRDGAPVNVDLQAVPLPAAVWLFGAGALLLSRTARKKKSGLG